MMLLVWSTRCASRAVPVMNMRCTFCEQMVARIVPNPNRSGVAELFTAHRHRIINPVEYEQTDKWYGEGVMIQVKESANQ